MTNLTEQQIELRDRTRKWGDKLLADIIANSPKIHVTVGCELTNGQTRAYKKVEEPSLFVTNAATTDQNGTDDDALSGKISTAYYYNLDNRLGFAENQSTFELFMKSFFENSSVFFVLDSSAKRIAEESEPENDNISSFFEQYPQDHIQIIYNTKPTLYVMGARDLTTAVEMKTGPLSEFIRQFDPDEMVL